jgi:hypothetical protein
MLAQRMKAKQCVTDVLNQRHAFHSRPVPPSDFMQAIGEQIG